MYHRVLPDRVNPFCHVQPGMYVSTSVFERHLVFLRDHFEVVFLEDLLHRAITGKSLSGLCAVTFDDGWRDNFSEAFPLLQRYSVPATIFLATGFVGTQRLFWPEELCSCLGRVELQQLTAEDAPSSLQHLGQLMIRLEDGDRDIFLDGCIAALKGFSPQARREVMFRLAGLAGEQPIQRQMLSWDEARAMAAGGLVAFGSHTVNHELLDQLEPNTARKEIAGSCAIIEGELGAPVRLFAYPNGNHTGLIRTLLAELGLHGAVTTKRGLVGHRVSTLEIPRIAMHEDVSRTIPLFRSRTLLPLF